MLNTTNFLRALEQAGVDNWEWYDESLQDLTEEELNDDKSVYEALIEGGVDNWEGYSEAFEIYHTYASDISHMTRDGLAQAVTQGLDSQINFNEMDLDSQNDVLEGVDALLALYEKNPTPDKETIMSTFASAYENAPPDISEWDEDYKREMRNVAEFVNIYACLVS